MKAVFLDYATLGPADLDLTPLNTALPGMTVYDDTSDEQRIEHIGDAEAIFLNKVKIDADVFAAASNLKYVGLVATGTDNVDLEVAKARGIAVCNLVDYCTQSVVEHVIGCMLSLTHNLPRYRKLVGSGGWQDASNFSMLNYPIRELSALTLGLVGSGSLGGGVAKAVAAFGMRVMTARRAGTEGSPDDGRYDLDDVLREADVLSLHCPLNDATRGMIDARALSLMKPTAILINTARGGLVDSAALAAALREDRIGGAAIDVLPQEPPVDGDPLLDYDGDNLIITPHIAWGTREARQNGINELALNFEAFKRGERRNRVV